MAQSDSLESQRWGGNTRQSDPTGGRAKILAAARRCYARSGIAGTTLDDIARQAKISRRTLYRYFENKKAIIQAVVDEQALEVISRMVADIRDDSLPFCVQLQRYVIYLIKQGQQAPGYQLLLGRENIGQSEAFYSSSATIFKALMDLIQSRFADARSRGEIRGDINCGQLIAWVGRIVLSYSHLPASDEDIDWQIEQLLIPALKA